MVTDEIIQWSNNPIENTTESEIQMISRKINPKLINIRLS